MVTNKNSRKHQIPEAAEVTNTPLAELLRAKGYSEKIPPTAPASPTPTSAPDQADRLLARAGKLVLRREKKGRGGKTVTLLSGLELHPAGYEEVAKALRKGLGCGSSVEAKTIVLQGDIQERAETWLRAHGATKVVQGN